MAGSLTSAGANMAVDFVTGRALTYSAARTTYAALCTAAIAPTAAISDLAELTTAGYARNSVAWATPSYSVSGSSTTNSSPVTFGPMAADMASPVIWVALISAATGTVGDLLYAWQLDVPAQVLSGESIQFLVGSLTMTFL